MRMEKATKIIQPMKLRIFSLSLCLILTTHAEREALVSEDVYMRIKECIHDYHHPFVRSSDELEAKALREKAFAGLDDREKIRALAEWIFRTPPPHYYGISSQAAKLLIAPEPVIKDYSELRRLMAGETDSRRFYQLYTLSSYGERNGHDFMADRARGLFMEGVAADRGQSATDHPLNSISDNSFSRISEQLRGESQTFKEEVFPDLIRMDPGERNLALARWLKANWPGCENLEIPEKDRKRIDAFAREPYKPRGRLEERLKETNEAEETASASGQFPWLWITAAVLLLGLFAWLGKKRRP
jgi:hypothetical protein